jgi:hypothetical protein
MEARIECSKTHRGNGSASREPWYLGTPVVAARRFYEEYVPCSATDRRAMVEAGIALAGEMGP